MSAPRNETHMIPHGSRIVNPEIQLGQLEAGHYLRLGVRATSAEKLRAFLRLGHLRAKQDVHDLLNHAARHQSWPGEETIRTLRFDPTDKFDAELFVSSAWPSIHEGFTVVASPKRAQRRKTRTIVVGATNREKRVR